MPNRSLGKKVALITGITGQDGAYLSELLLTKGYSVHGIKRRSSSFNTSRIDHLIEPEGDSPRIQLHYGDLSDSSSITSIMERVGPDEIYNLGAQSHVAVSFESPEYTANVTGLGALRLLEAMRFVGLGSKAKFYQASSSELFGQVQETPQRETTPFYPRSPYAVSKLFAYWTVRNYREAYGIYATNGILFNHESPRRGETFVTQKIVRALARIYFGEQGQVILGNLDAKRDWGHAKDYVDAQWLMMQLPSPGDYVVSTGQQYSVRDFFKMACGKLGISVSFSGRGLDEVAIVDEVNSDAKVRKGQIILRVSSKYFRAAEVDTLLGDSSRLRELTGWKPIYCLDSLCSDMVSEALNSVGRIRYGSSYVYQHLSV